MTTAIAKEGRKAAAGIKIAADELQRALQAVEPAVARAMMPLLQNVLLSDGHLTATDLEIRISVPVDAASGPPMLLPFSRLMAISRTISAGQTVTLKHDGTACKIKAGGSEWRLPVEDASEYPAGSVDEGGAIGRLPSDQLTSLVSSVRFACDTQSSRYALGAVLVEFARGEADDEDGTLTFVATDGRRLAAATAKLAAQDLDASSTLVPVRAINALMRLAKGTDAVQMSATATEFVAVVGEYQEGRGVVGVTIRARLTEGRFPRWQDVDTLEVTEPSPRRYREPATLVVLGELEDAISQARICTSESSKGVDLTVSHDGIRLHAQAETGEAAIRCDVVDAGHPVTIRIDPTFALQWLSCGAFDRAETIAIEVRDHESAIAFRAGDCRNIMWPMAGE